MDDYLTPYTVDDYKEKFPNIHLSREQSIYFITRYHFNLVDEYIETIEDLDAKLLFLLEIKTDFERDVKRLWVIQSHSNRNYGLSDAFNFGELCQIEVDKIKELQEFAWRKKERESPEENLPINIAQTQLREDTYKKRSGGGSHYQNLLAMHYLLEYLKAKDNKSAKARFASFLTGFSKNTFYNDSFNIHAKQDEDGVKWEKDMELVKSFFTDLGLNEIVRMIKNDLDC
ncbi:MAG: hypothetical protein WKF90_12140 [Pyrinomonadaceae bacterium]